jgi:hypothetical protein
MVTPKNIMLANTALLIDFKKHIIAKMPAIFGSLSKQL